MVISHDQNAIHQLKELASKAKIDIAGAKVRRSSSRFCLGVEHGDYYADQYAVHTCKVVDGIKVLLGDLK